MMSCALPSAAALSDYLTDREQSFVNVFALSKLKPENCQIAQETSFAQALISVSHHMEVLMRNSTLVSSAFDSTLRTHPAAEKMQQFLESVKPVQAIQPWTAVLRMHDFLEATISNLLTQAFAGPNPLDASHIQACRTVMEEELLKKLPEDMSPAEMEQLRGIFSTVLQCELALLESSLAKKGLAVPELAKLNKSPWHPSNILFTTDFDITCTQVDSCYSLVQAAEVAAGKRPTSLKFAPEALHEEYESILVRHAERQKATFLSFDSQEHEAEDPTYWRDADHSENRFLCGMDPSLQSLCKPLADDITTSEGEGPPAPYNEAGLRKALVKLAKLEVLCNEDVVAARVLSGATKDEIRAEARKVLMRPNCVEVLQQLEQLGTPIHVVSANWSRDLILGGLPDLRRDQLFVHCNDLSFDAAGASEGTLDMTVVDAFDKEKTLRTLRRLPALMTSVSARDDSDESPARSSARPVDRMLVYLGDSHTDLLGLLEADLGIVIGESPLLRRVLSLYDIELLPLTEATAHIAVARLCGSTWSCRKSGILFEAQGWTDVEACLFGRGEMSSDSPLLAKIEKLIEETRSQQQQQQSMPYDDRVRDITPFSLDMIKTCFIQPRGVLHVLWG
ncbi:thiamine phosphate phosphatase / amino-HMP aminohydrolase [Marchantia polymorpha subsp. ruderalis]|uniref:Uncharacterized protein n=2 Tax=Marchantia polymorpha TaxID=3197 RepID=A0AAF6BXH1_MARPO|nr:hypothetical protein MARPO_0068s0016 [Marchantia polymorpha]BBN16705.1 hypothetical protein Mp_7g08620 [Marchantia polymorpha subsp. ruderalis]|eukprot:PTQ35788.1 hypothetical protein MARPO_0068s0016 [Marchantia polymorpha]